MFLCDECFQSYETNKQTKISFTFEFGQAKQEIIIRIERERESRADEEKEEKKLRVKSNPPPFKISKDDTTIDFV